MTAKQAKVYAELLELGDNHPTARSLTDRLDQRYHRSERWTEDEVRGILRRLQSDGYVSKYRGKKNEVRFQPIGSQAGGE